MSSDMDLVEYDYDLSHFNAIADLRGISWLSIEEQMVDLQPTEIPEEVHELETLNPFTFLHSLTRDPSMRNSVRHTRKAQPSISE